MMRWLSLSACSRSGRGTVVIAAGAFALGHLAGARAIPPLPAQWVATAAPVSGAMPASASAPAAAMRAQKVEPRLAYQAEVVRVIDGDTFEARVAVWPGIEVDTKVRLRGIDAPELHARCDDERVHAQAARAALERMLAEGGVAGSQVGIDKYGGRVDAAVSTRDTADVSAALLGGGWARRYDGGRRGSWC